MQTKYKLLLEGGNVNSCQLRMMGEICGKAVAYSHAIPNNISLF